MDRINREQLLEYSVKTGLTWIISHFAIVFLFNRYGSFDIVNSHYYNAIVYILMAVYVMSLLMFNALLWYTKSQEANKVMRRYWAISCVITTIWFLFGRSLMASRAGRDIVILFFIWQLSPLAPMIPLSYVIIFQKLGIEWDRVMEWHSIIVLFISAVHYLYFCLLSKRTD
jgi:hypothetical protein